MKTSWGTGQRTVCGVGTDKGLWMKTHNGAQWGNWQSIGGTFISVVIIITKGNGYGVYGIGDNKEV